MIAPTCHCRPDINYRCPLHSQTKGDCPQAVAGHTPGPWYAAVSSIFANGFVDSRSGAVCNMTAQTERIANGHLIAAAPDLLSALKHILAGALSLPRFAEEEGRAAIAKAEGRS